MIARGAPHDDAGTRVMTIIVCRAAERGGRLQHVTANRAHTDTANSREARGAQKVMLQFSTARAGGGVTAATASHRHRDIPTAAREFPSALSECELDPCVRLSRDLWVFFAHRWGVSSRAPGALVLE